MSVFVVMRLMLVVMMVLAGGLRFASAAGELMYQLDKLVRRGVVLPGHVARLDRDGPIVQDGQFHFGLHVSTPF